MRDLPRGLPSYHLRAESWECDIHRHWSTRFYCRSFDIAAQSACLLTGVEPPPKGVEHRHFRFHAEVLESDAVRIETFASRKAEPESIVHCMFRHDTLVATARDEVDFVPDCLPELPEAYESAADARGLRNVLTSAWKVDPARDFQTVVEPVQALELAGRARGRLPIDAAFRRSTFASLHHIAHIGFSADFTRESHIGRMVAELRYQAIGDIGVGELVRGASRLVSVSEKSFVTSHMLARCDGSPIAVFDLCCLAVDMHRRKACALPDFLRPASVGS